MDLKEIQNLIKFVAKSGASEVKLEMEDVKITIKTGSEDKNGETTTFVQQIPMNQPMPQQGIAPQPVAAPAETEASSPATKEDDSKYITIKSPIIGTFYRRPSPDKPNFAEVGDTIAKGDVLCIIEAMKIMNQIEADIDGKLIRVLVENGDPVEYGQPLFVIDPS